MRIDELFSSTAQKNSGEHQHISWWERVQRWITANTFTPAWWPEPLRAQLVGYWVAILLQIVAMAGVVLLSHLYPGFTFREAPSILVILLVALEWGATSGVCATFFGIVFTVFLSLPLFYTSQMIEPEDAIGIVLYISIGLIISLLTSQVQRARAEADRERRRFQDVFLQAPLPILVLNGPEHRVEMLNPAASANTGVDGIDGRMERDVFTGCRMDDLLQKIDEVYKTGNNLIIKEFYVPGNRRDDNAFDAQYFNLTYRPMRDQWGKINDIIVVAIDVTDEVQARKRIEVAEQQAAERVQEVEGILNAIADPIFIFDSQGNPYRINQAADKLMRDSAETLPNGQLRENNVFNLYDVHDRLLPEEKRPRIRVLAGETLQGATAVDVIMRMADGRRLDMSITGAPVRTADGHIHSAVLAVRDVTARRRIEQERVRLLASEQAVLNVIPVSILIADAQGRLLRGNTVFEQMWGKNAPMLESKDEYSEYKGWWSSNGRRLASKDWGLFRALTTGEVSSNEEIDIEAFDGQRKTILNAAAPIYDEQGKLLGGVVAMLDVTEQRQLERRTHDALEALLSMAQMIVQGPVEININVGAFNSDTMVTSLSQNPLARQSAQRVAGLAYEVLGCKRMVISMVAPESMRNVPLAVMGLSPELEQLWWRDVSASYVSDFLDQQSLARLQKEEVLILDLVGNAPIAREYYGFGLTMIVPLLNGDRLLGVLVVDYDEQEHQYTQQEIALTRAVARLMTLVIEREQLLTERAEARASELALRNTNRLKDEFIGIAGHELRTPLTTIKASVQLAQRQLRRVMLQQADLPEDVTKSIAAVQNFLERTERQVGMLNRLVNDLLDVSRIETGRLELHPVLCDIIALVGEAVEDQRHLTAERVLTLTLPVSPEQTMPSELLVMADADRLRQVISNYLSNALKYSDADKPVAVSVKLDGAQVRVSVCDEGPGLVESQQQRVWERFYRAPGIEVKSGSGVGLGLGLHISRMIIERQGGLVGLQSAPGRGSTFWFTLPLAE